MPASEYLNFKRSQEVLDEEQRRKQMMKMNYKHVANMNGQIQPTPLNNAEFYSKFGYIMQEYIEDLLLLIEALNNVKDTDIDFFKDFNKLMLIYNSPLFNSTDKNEFKSQLKTTTNKLQEIILLCDEKINDVMDGDLQLEDVNYLNDTLLFNYAVASLQKEYIDIGLFKIITLSDIETRIQKIINDKNIPKNLLIDLGTREKKTGPDGKKITGRTIGVGPELGEEGEDEPGLEEGEDVGEWGSISVNRRREIDEASNPANLAESISSAGSVAPYSEIPLSSQGLRFSPIPSPFQPPVLERGLGEAPTMQSRNLTSGMPSSMNPPLINIPPPAVESYLELPSRQTDINLEPPPQRQPVNPPDSRRLFQQNARNIRQSEIPSFGERMKTVFKSVTGQGRKKNKKTLDKEQVDIILSKLNQPTQMKGKSKKKILNNQNMAEDLNQANYKSFMFNK